MFSDFYLPISLWELSKRVVQQTIDDNCFGMAAQLAYYFLFALFPTLLFIVALASFFPVENLIDEMVTWFGHVTPPDIMKIITDQLRDISESRDTGLPTFGLLAALWTMSTAQTAIIGTLNQAYTITESRPFWKVRLIAVLLTITMAIFLLVSFAMLIVGPNALYTVADWAGFGWQAAYVWSLLRWPVAFALVVTAVGLIYYVAPDAEQDWIWITPGSLLATTLWVAASLGFRYYVGNFGNFNETYGAIGGVMVLMMWLYITAFVILVGAEVNSEIEHASPHGKAPGERRPGERRQLGARARRAYEEALAARETS
jgi:membrane protein